MANCVKCGAALPWAGKSCAFCGTPVSQSENIEAIAVAAADNAAAAAAVAVTAASLPADDSDDSDVFHGEEEITEEDIAAYQARSRRRSIWGFAAALLGILLLALPTPVNVSETEQVLRPASLVSWDAVAAVIDTYSEALSQYEQVGLRTEGLMFVVGTLLANLIYILTGLLLIVTGLVGALRTRRLPRWALVIAPVLFMTSLLVSLNGYYPLMEFLYAFNGLSAPPITELYKLVFGFTDTANNWGSLMTNLVLPTTVVLVGLFGGAKDPRPESYDEDDYDEEFEDESEEELTGEEDELVEGDTDDSASPSQDKS